MRNGQNGSMDAVREMREEIEELKSQLSKLESHDDHDHGGADGRPDAQAEHLRKTLTEREAELAKRLIDTESADGFKGSKDLDAEAFGTTS